MTDDTRSNACAPGRGHQAQHEKCRAAWCTCRCHRSSTTSPDARPDSQKEK